MPNNQVGFDPKNFKWERMMEKPAGFKDPWARNDAWRYKGPFTRFQRYKGLFPGFGLAVVAFAGYVAYEEMFLKTDDHGHGHGEGH